MVIRLAGQRMGLPATGSAGVTVGDTCHPFSGKLGRTQKSAAARGHTSTVPMSSMKRALQQASADDIARLRDLPAAGGAAMLCSTCSTCSACRCGAVGQPPGMQRLRTKGSSTWMAPLRHAASAEQRVGYSARRWRNRPHVRAALRHAALASSVDSQRSRGRPTARLHPRWPVMRSRRNPSPVHRTTSGAGNPGPSRSPAPRKLSVTISSCLSRAL